MRTELMKSIEAELEALGAENCKFHSVDFNGDSQNTLGITFDHAGTTHQMAVVKPARCTLDDAAEVLKRWALETVDEKPTQS